MKFPVLSCLLLIIFSAAPVKANAAVVKVVTKVLPKVVKTTARTAPRSGSALRTAKAIADSPLADDALHIVVRESFPPIKESSYLRTIHEDCSECNGTGKTGFIFKDPCKRCSGSGRITIFIEKCGRCDGTGKTGLIFKDPCDRCHGTGEIRTKY